jgi:hypothetical protein
MTRTVGALPTLIVIGAQKCGTSALHAYLSVHPEVGMSRPKELDFFIAERNWRRGADWYRGHFDAERAVRGESSPNYSAHPTWTGVPARMAELVPDVRLIYLVRDPLQRIAAQWVHNWSLRRENHDPATALRQRATYVNRSRYMHQLDQFLACYPAERLLVVDQEDLRHRRLETLERVFRFLGIDAGFRHRSFAHEVHVTGGKRRITRTGAALDRLIRRSPAGRVVPAGAVARLESQFLRGTIDRPDIEAALSPEALELLSDDARRLRAFTGLALAHWSV